MNTSSHTQQNASHLLMIRPVNFGFNSETAVNNFFQTAGDAGMAQQKALNEFDQFVQLLTSHHIGVTVINDTPHPYTPDSIFPNNWVSFHEKGIMCLYPMFAPNRRQERKPELVANLQQQFGIKTTIDFTQYETAHRFLEGTGSMVLDRRFKIAYASLSPRTDQLVLLKFCEAMNFDPVIFNAVDEKGYAIYHTNVMMCVADKYAVVCLDSITDLAQLNKVVATINAGGKKIIPVTFEQMHHFAGNMLQVTNREGQSFLIMSSQARHSLSSSQLAQLEDFNPVLHVPLDTIETLGGGSARCMIAEVFL